MVDMKRLSEVLVKMSQQNRPDAVEQISRRFKSLRKMKIKIDPSAHTTLIIPEIPASLDVVIQHDDVTLVREFARGESATVFIGLWQNQEVAVKVFRLRTLSPAELESFRREIFVLATLNHSAILSLLGFTESAPFYIVTEFLKNDSLFKFLRKSPDGLTPTGRSIVAYDIARGLDFLHGRGVIHRDMKSLNVLLTDTLRAKIGDFGAVRLHLDGVKTGSIGTVHWMAPELLMSSPSYDCKVDVYSFGLVLWELLTGDLLYPDMRPPAIIEAVITGKRPEIPPDTPSGLARLICSCWSANPSDRPGMTRVVSMLSEPACHFPGTDEAAFLAATGVVYRHRSAHSLCVQRRGVRQEERLAIDLNPSDLED
jgi:serine/threonine protein kinase